MEGNNLDPKEIWMITHESDNDKQLELLKPQQAILNRQIELEKLKEGNSSRG